MSREVSPIRPEAVRALLSLPADSAGRGDQQVLDWAIEAATAAMIDARPDLAATIRATPAATPVGVVAGGELLAARLYARRSSPTGLEGFDDAGTVARVMIRDPDIERLLGIGRFAVPVIA